MTHNELFNLVLTLKDSLPDDDRDCVLTFAQYAISQFRHMKMGQEYLFHSSWSELCSCADACAHAWLRQKLSTLLSPDAPYFEACLAALTAALYNKYPCWEFRPAATGLPHSIRIDFPLYLHRYVKEVH